MPTLKHSLSRAALLPAMSLISGCDLVVLHPFGAIATQQGHLILISTFLMLLIVVPVLGLTFFFAWRYRASNPKATYTPEWDHSTALELVIWTAPLFIVIALGAVTWINTHTLDPYRALRRSDATHMLPAGSHPLVVDVVALDWKWLFIYPEQGIATVNELAAPVDMPIEFRITSSSVMNSFFIPALAGQIYAMPGMQTELHAIINHAGQYEGFSANYSGAGFSGMHFKFHGMNHADFDQWVERARSGNEALSRDAYMRLAQPSERDPVHRYSGVAPGLYDAILTQCVARAC
jgi:cytochrome o ubiquinol oxidase subunit 2